MVKERVQWGLKTKLPREFMVLYVPRAPEKIFRVFFCLPVIPAEVKGLLGMDFGVQIPPNPKVFWKPRVYVEQTKSLDWVGVFIFRVYLHPCGKWWNFTSIFIKWSWNHQPVEGSKFLELRSICEKDDLLGNTRDLLIFRLRKKRVVSIVDYIELLRCTGAYIPGNSLWPFWDG